MAAVGSNNIVRCIYRGEEGEFIPFDVTHVTVHEFTTFVRARAFWGHPNIVEVICHDKVEKIEVDAFRSCPCLRRVIIPGVKKIENFVFNDCFSLTDLECGKLEIINVAAFMDCRSLRSVNLPSARIVRGGAFHSCETLMSVKFGNKLERIKGDWAFRNCRSLGRITLPLKDGMITSADTFQGCEYLMHVDLIEGGVYQKIIAALQLKEWRDDINEDIDSINQILPNARAGEYSDEYYDDDDDDEDYSAGEKARAIRTWIRSVLRKIIHYQLEHQRVLNEEAATTLQLVSPQDIVFRNVLPFLELPSHTFEVEEDENEDDHDASHSEESSSEGEESEEE